MLPIGPTSLFKHEVFRALFGLIRVGCAVSPVVAQVRGLIIVLNLQRRDTVNNGPHAFPALRY